MRKFLFFAAIALSGFASAQDVKVTYSTVAVPATRAVAEISQKAGVKLQCSAAMDKEVVILRLQDAPLSEVMKQIAAVTSGTWNKEGDTSFLVPNGSMRQAEENRGRQRFADLLSKNLKKNLDDQAKKQTGGPTASPAPTMVVAFSGGGDPNLLKLAAAIGPDQLASVPDGGRVVFSTSPNGMQRGLPASANAIINDFVIQHNKVAAASKQEEPAKDAGDENMAAIMEIFGSRFKKPQPIKTAPAKAIVIASRRGMFMGYTLELKLYDTNGKVLASAMAPLATNMPFDPQQFMNPAAGPPKSEGTEIQLSPLAKELYGASKSLGAMGGASNLKFSKELTASLQDPVAHDPLSYAHSEALLAIAEQKHEQLVANLPDGVLSFFGNLTPKGTLTSDAFLKDIQGDQKAKISETNGWMIVSPDDPVDARRDRADRSALRTLIQLAQRNGVVRLDDLAAYAVRNGSPMDDAPATGTYIMLFAPSALQQGMMGMTNWDLLRLYGMLGSTERQSLRQGGRLVFGSVSPQVQSQLSKMLFGADESLQIEQQRQGQKQDPLMELIMSQVDRFAGSADADYRTEPTEIMPNGLPSNGFIAVNFSSEPVAQPQTTSTDFGRGASLSAMELGMFKFFKEDPNLSQIGGMMPTMDDLKVGTRTVYNFSFNVAPAVSSKGTLNDDSIDKDAQVYKMDALPADFQKRIDDMAATFKKNPIWGIVGRMGGFGNRGVPPQ